MPGCCVTDCKNRSERGFRLFRLPTGQRNEQRRSAWLRFINRGELPDRALICEAHFNECQFEIRRADGNKKLKCTAVLSIKIEDLETRSRKRKHSDDQDTIVDGDDIENDTYENFRRTEDPHINNLQFKILKEKLKTAEARIRALTKQVQQLEGQYKGIFNEDQIHFLKYGHGRGVQWSNETIKKALKLYTACGAKGYNELRSQNFPIPSIRTLQQRIENFKFQPGICEHILHLLELKVTTFNEQEKHAALLLDEMAIKPGLQYDNSTKTIMGRPTMMLSGNKDSSDKLATHALVFMLAGISTRWKQTLGYELTASSYSGDEVLAKLVYIIKKSADAGITIKTIISDMGPANRSYLSRESS